MSLAFCGINTLTDKKDKPVEEGGSFRFFCRRDRARREKRLFVLVNRGFKGLRDQFEFL